MNDVRAGVVVGLMVVLPIAGDAGAADLPLFMVTKGSQFIVADSSGILMTSPIPFAMSALSVVPDGVVMPGASPGDVIGGGNDKLIRIDDPLGQPTLVTIKPNFSGGVDMTFAKGTLFAVATQGGTIIVREYDMNTLEVAQTYQTGIMADGFGGLAYMASEDVFYLTEKDKFDALYRWKPNENAVQVCKPPFAFGNNDLEQFGDDTYGAFATGGMLLVGLIDTSTCDFQSMVQMSYSSGQVIGMAVLPRAACYADCDENGALDLFDFLCFVNHFNSGAAAADCDQNAVLDLFDFLCFVNAFNAGCP